MDYDIRDIDLATGGRHRIDWANQKWPCSRAFTTNLKRPKPLQGIRIGATMHVTTETANLMRALQSRWRRHRHQCQQSAEMHTR